MDRHLFHQANAIYSWIQIVEDKKLKLLDLRIQIIETLKGHTEIPDSEVREALLRLDNLSKYLDKGIKKQYEQIDKL